MKTRIFSLPVLALGTALLAGAQGGPAGGKVGIIHIQNAILSTNDGQKAAKELETKFAPKKAELEKLQNDVARLQDAIQKGSNTLSDEARQKLMRERDQKNTKLTRDTQDAQEEAQAEEAKIMQELYQRLQAVIDKYARDNGLVLVLDVSSPQNPVMYAASSIDITKDIIELYNKNAPSAPAPKPTSTLPAAKPPVVTSPAVRPPAPLAPKTTPPPKK